MLGAIKSLPLSSAKSALRRPFQVCGFRLASTLVVAEHDNKSLNGSTLSAVAAAQQIGGDVSLLVIGNGSSEVASAAASVDGVSKVLHIDNPTYEKWVGENICEAVAATQKAGGFSHVVTVASKKGQNFLGRLGAVLDCNPLPDIVQVVDEETFVRPMYAGNAMATVKVNDPVKLLSVRPTSFDKVADSGGSAAVEAADAPEKADTGMSSFVSEAVSSSDRPDLGAARVVVSGGRGLKAGENFKMLEDLADKLGGAVGASRAAVDAGYVPNELQVGQTGKVVAPELYIAVGISGAIQHLSGMKDSKVIVAINKDKEAPIFQVADYGLVDDLFKAVPELIAKV
eukprot:CAMPEP_0113936762 /NCGR_PEP_ID=MMETSP1339-20121228/3570_1 /TAXON_ID=94617 /ORGANISM="Fibrocapsa japonica" /LENGTH=341 /DNA_ID=CAMNT_0000939313 /DNA_START=98 /DNA_END=1123 /DNA_ORIENTATION=- /assembly_acc=CAM_ASM_000762